MYIYLAIIGYTLLGIVALFDKFIVSGKKMLPITFAFFATIFTIPLFLLVPFGITPLGSMTQYAIALIAGIAYFIGLYTMYTGYLHGEVSRVGPLIGAVTPLCITILSRFFLHEIISTQQYIGIAFLILGSLIIAIKRGGWQPGFWWGIAAGLSFAVFHVSSKYIYTLVNFWSGFVWVWGAMGICALVMLVCSRPLRLSLWSEKTKNEPTAKNKIVTVIINDTFAFGGIFFIQPAVALGSVTLVNAMSGLEYALVVILAAILARIKPAIFKEQYSRAESIQKTLAVMCIIIGLALLLT